MAYQYRHPADGASPRRVGILAVDPSSPFTGGAILGDRVRMRDLAGDPGVFIRSMASRGSLGGLAAATSALVDVMDAAGFDVILVETVGAGQGEVDVASLAHTTLVVEAPGLGDDIQAIKAGILEIADILVVNKADLPGVENTERALRGLLQLAHPITHPLADIFETPCALETANPPVAERSPGRHPFYARWRQMETASRTWWQRSTVTGYTSKKVAVGQSRIAPGWSSQLDHLLKAELVSRWRKTVSETHVQSVLDRLSRRELSPGQAVDMLLNGGRD